MIKRDGERPCNQALSDLWYIVQEWDFIIFEDQAGMYLLLSSEQRAPVPAAIKCRITRTSGTEGALELNGTFGSFKSDVFLRATDGIIGESAPGRLFALVWTLHSSNSAFVIE